MFFNKGENMREREFETGMDEQAKQGAMNKLSESVTTLARDNDRSSDYLEEMRRLTLAEREQGLSERRNREHTTHLANLKSLDHHGFGFDRLNNTEPKEAVAINEMMKGEILEALRVIMVDIMKELSDKK